MGRESKPSNNSLTDFELNIMTIIWKEGPSTVHDVQANLKKQKTYAYTTISTVLRLLKKKGFLSTTSLGRTHIYRAEVKKDSYRLRILRTLIEQLFSDSPISLIQSLIEGYQLDEEELNAFQNILDTQKRNNSTL